MNTQNQNRTTFESLCEIEPELRTLFEEATALKHGAAETPDGYFCANEVWYGAAGLKARMSQLVGFEARNPALCTCEAYDLAYDAIYRQLGDCRNCGCYGDAA